MWGLERIKILETKTKIWDVKSIIPFVFLFLVTLKMVTLFAKCVAVCAAELCQHNWLWLQGVCKAEVWAVLVEEAYFIGFT